MLSTRAWLTLTQRTDPRGTGEMVITTALRRQVARARPSWKQRGRARSAHAVRRVLRDQDREGAREMAEPPADMLAILGEDVRRRCPPPADRLARAAAAGPTHSEHSQFVAVFDQVLPRTAFASSSTRPRGTARLHTPRRRSALGHRQRLARCRPLAASFSPDTPQGRAVALYPALTSVSATPMCSSRR